MLSKHQRAFAQKRYNKVIYIAIIVGITFIFQSLYTNYEFNLITTGFGLFVICIAAFYRMKHSELVTSWIGSVAICGLFCHEAITLKDITIPIISMFALQFYVSRCVFCISFLFSVIAAIVLLLFNGNTILLLDVKPILVLGLINMFYSLIYHYFYLRKGRDVDMELLVHDIKSALSANYSYLSTVRELFLSGIAVRSKNYISINYTEDIAVDLVKFSKLTVDVSLQSKSNIDKMLG